MNIKPLVILTFVALLVPSALAQTSAAPTKPASSSAPAASGPVPTTKIAIIEIAAFGEGIGELKQRYEKLRGEFGPRANEMESIQTMLAAQEKQLSDTSKMTPQQVKSLSDKFELLKKEFQRKQEDYQAEARKREETETSATYDKINQFLEKYAAERGITMVLEAGALRQNGVVIYAAPGLLITEDFIKEYNKANPGGATAAPAAKKPASPR